MKVHWVSAIRGPVDEINRTRSTPSSAGPRVSGSSMSPSTSSTIALSSSSRAGAVADQRPDRLAVAGELVDYSGSIQAGRAGNEDCHGLRLLVEMGWVSSRTRERPWRRQAAVRLVAAGLPPSASRRQRAGGCARRAVLLHFW